jgi:hypothetical protein
MYVTLYLDAMNLRPNFLAAYLFPSNLNPELLEGLLGLGNCNFFKKIISLKIKSIHSTDFFCSGRRDGFSNIV